MRRRMAERRRRRAKANETEQEGEEKQADEPHYLGANLLEGLKSTGTRWNGGVAKNPELQQWRRFWELGLARARAAAAGSFYRGGRWPWRAGPRGTRRRARGRVGLEPESGSVGEEDAPDRRGPPGGESGRGKGRWAGTGRKARRTGRRGGKRDGAPVGPKQKK